MSFRPLSSQNTNSTNVGQINDMIRSLIKREQVQIFKDETGTRRVLLGRGPNGFHGLKVSKPDNDVYTAADSELVFNSDQNVFKIVYTDSALLDIPARTGTGPYAEGYVQLDINTGVVSTEPLAVMGFWDTSGYLAPSYWQLPFVVNTFNTTTGTYSTELKVTINSFLSGGTVWVRLIGENAGGALASDVRYYVLQETAGG